MKLSPSFYTRDDVVAVASDLLGKVLCTRLNGELTEAIIIETEAYAGVTDKASHAYGGRRTKRTEPLFGQGGTAYVYLCYGIHHLFNVVTNEAETPHAVLIRAGTPMTGTERMLKRRKKEQVDKTLLAGPRGSVWITLAMMHSGRTDSGQPCTVRITAPTSQRSSRVRIISSAKTGVDAVICAGSTSSPIS
jgi:DNA-3-methyladenine glycosylase